MVTRSLCVALALVLGGVLAGCDKPAEAPTPAAAKAPVAKVALTPEGQTFKPPIKKEAIPEEGWYCDMGTVHYARSEEGDHKCPICKMKLKQKIAAK